MKIKQSFVAIFAIIGLVFTLFTTVFFSQDTGIKVGRAYDIAKRAIGFGPDYTAFTANSIDDYLDIFSRGMKYNLGFYGDPYQTIDLMVDMDGMSSLNQQRTDRSKRKWVAAKIKLEKKSGKKDLHKVKIRSKGDRALHVSSFDTMSFKVDIKGSKRLHGMEEFSVQRPIIRNYGWEMLINSIGNQLGLLTPDITPINFHFNGDSRGIYMLEEGFGSEFLERRGKKVGPIYSLNEPLGEKFPDVVYEAYETKKIDSNSRIIYDNARMKLLELKKTYNSEDFDPSIYFDLQQWASYFSVIDLFASYHGAVPKSVKLYFNPSTQLFEPIFFDNHVGGRGYLKFSLMDFKYLKDYSKCGYACEHHDWFELFYKDNRFFDLYTRTLESFIARYKQGDFNLLVQEVELFNNAMYASLAPSDRLFYSGMFPYYFDINHLNKRINLLETKLNEYVGSNYKDTAKYKVKSPFSLRYFKDSLLLGLPHINKYCRNYEENICSEKDINFIHMHNFTLTGETYPMPENSVLILSGKTDIRDSVLIGSESGSMIVQIGGEFVTTNTKFEALTNMYIAGANWSGAINIIKSNVTMNNISIHGTFGEDALNIVESRARIDGGIRFSNIQEDALDGDSIDLLFDSISCVNVGNDCLDTSGSSIKGGDVRGVSIGDKLVSLGEETNATLGEIECTDCGIGVAIKDSSHAKVDSILLENTPLEVAIFQKKRIFDSASLVVNNNIHNKSSRGERLIGKGCFLVEGGTKTIGNIKSKDAKKMMYGNQYGRASNR
jgi:hypothetical protein